MLLVDEVEDKGAYTGQLGYAYPTLAVRLRPTPQPTEDQLPLVG